MAPFKHNLLRQIQKTKDIAVPGDFEKFIGRWRNADGSEKANYQLFLTELCETLDLPKPAPAAADTETIGYTGEHI